MENENPIIDPSNEISASSADGMPTSTPDMPPAPSMPPLESAQGEPAKPKFKFNKDITLIVIAVLAVVITGVLLLSRTSLGDKIPFLNSMSTQQAAQKAVDYLNANSSTYLQGQSATLVSASEVSGLVKISLKIGSSPYDSYVTRDGKLLFPTAIQLPASAGKAGTTQTPTASGVDISKVKTEGEPYIGDVNAKVVMAFWSDYQCPFCKKAVVDVFPQLMKDYVDTGKVKIVFKDYAFLGADSQTLGKFARAVWEASPAKFGTWHQAIFVNQGQENTGWATTAKIMQITTTAIGSADANKALALFNKNGDAYQKAMDADKAEGTSFNVNGTPGTIIGTTFINGAEAYSSFKTAIDGVLNGK